MLEVTIDRTCWIRGGYAGTTAAEATPEDGGVVSVLTKKAEAPGTKDMHCCMGFAALTAGIPREHTVNVGTIRQVQERDEVEVPEVLKTFVTGPQPNGGAAEEWRKTTERVGRIYYLNDTHLREALGGTEGAGDAPRTEAEREQRLKTAAERLGLRFTFVN